jgi:acyl carrier protein
MTITLQEDLIEFVSIELGINASRLLPSTSLNYDLGIDGDDGLEFMSAFSQRFGVNLSAFDASQYFGPEAGVNIFMWSLWFVARIWPKFAPLTLGDLQVSIQAGQWVLEADAGPNPSFGGTPSGAPFFKR